MSGERQRPKKQQAPFVVDTGRTGMGKRRKPDIRMPPHEPTPSEAAQQEAKSRRAKRMAGKRAKKARRDNRG